MKFTLSAFMASLFGSFIGIVLFTVGYKLLFKEKIDENGVKKTSFLGSDQSEQGA